MTDRGVDLARDLALPSPVDALRKQLTEAHDKLCDFIRGGDHFCDDKGCDRENPKCDHMLALIGLADLREALMPRHVGAHAERVRGRGAERVYAEEWARENTPMAGRNGGHMTLELLLDNRSPGLGAQEWARVPPMISQRDAFVAATVIQWLGTNVGRSFVEKCEARIQQERAVTSDLAPWDMLNRQVFSDDEALARVACSSIAGLPEYDALVKSVTAAFAFVRTSSNGGRP